jgi:hypothetical protein
MHGSEPASPHHLCDGAGIVAVGLDRHRLVAARSRRVSRSTTGSPARVSPA